MVNYEICVSSRKQRDISQLTKMVKCKICIPYYKSREILQLRENAEGQVRDLYSFI